MIKVEVKYTDGTTLNYNCQGVDFSHTWVSLTFVDDEQKRDVLSIPMTAIKEVREVQYCE